MVGTVRSCSKVEVTKRERSDEQAGRIQERVWRPPGVSLADHKVPLAEYSGYPLYGSRVRGAGCNTSDDSFSLDCEI